MASARFDSLMASGASKIFKTTQRMAMKFSPDVKPNVEA